MDTHVKYQVQDQMKYFKKVLLVISLHKTGKEKKNQNFFLLLSMINLRIMNSQLSNITHIYMFETKNKLNLFQ